MRPLADWDAVSALRPALLAALAASRLMAQQGPGEVSPDALFAGALPRIDLRLDPSALKALEKDPRAWVDFVLAEQGGATLKDCHIKLKGSANQLMRRNRPVIRQPAWRRVHPAPQRALARR